MIAFRNVPASVIRDLAADSARNGLRERIEILPDGTVISGHQRLRAIRLLGWAKVDVIVRHDLVAAGEQAVHRALLEANANRQHLSILERLENYYAEWSLSGQLQDPSFDLLGELARHAVFMSKT